MNIFSIFSLIVIILFATKFELYPRNDVFISNIKCRLLKIVERFYLKYYDDDDDELSKREFLN